MKPLLTKAIEDYASTHSLPASPLLQELEAYTRAHRSDAQMLIGPLEGALLRMLVYLVAPKRVLEIGLFTGYSALTMAEALPNDGQIISCDVNPETTAIAQSFFARSPHGNKIRVRLGPALETLRSFTDERFEFVFLDADKESYVDYYEQIIPRLSAGGVIVADNVLWSGRVLAPENASDHALVAFNEHVQRDDRVENVMLTVRDGVTVIRKR